MRTEQEEATTANANDTSTPFVVGAIVQVQSRTWPGINRPGGIGRITQVYFEQDKVSNVDVQYTVVGGRERRVPIQYVQAAAQQERDTHLLRDRSVLLGRCKRCGSLRTDCGSCDWMTPQEVNQEPTTKRMTKSRRKRLAKQHESEYESSSSSSSDDELLELLKADERRQRGYLREKKEYDRVLGKVAERTDSEDSDGEDDPILARLAQLSKRRSQSKTSFLQQKYNPRKKEKHHRLRRIKRTAPSILESLNKPASPQRGGTARHKTNREHSSSASSKDSHHEGVKNDNRVTREAQEETDEDMPSPAKARETQAAATMNDGDEEMFGDPDFTQGDPIPSPASAQSSEDENIPLKQAPRATTVQPSSEGLYNYPSLDGFIQPDGAPAAQHLPTDVRDTTLDVPFKDLPSYVDELIQQLGDDRIPDARMDVTEFRKKLENETDAAALVQLKEEGKRLYLRIQKSLVKDGIDQCRVAMGRITDPKLYRRHRKDLSASEKEQFRGFAIELRDMKLDQVASMVENVMRDAKFLVEDDERTSDESDVGESDATTTSGEIDVPDGILTQDLHGVGFDHFEQDTGGDAARLPAFDPHMYASRVKSKGPQQQHPGRKRDRMGTRSRGTRKDASGRTFSASRSDPGIKRKPRQRKRSKTTDSHDVESQDGFYMDDDSLGPPDVKSSTKRRRQHRRKAPSKSHDNESHDESDSDGQSVGPFGIDPGSPAHDDEQRSRRQTGARRGTGSASTSVHFHEEQGNSIHFSSGAGTNRAPIADRMQAFLDANSSNLHEYEGFSSNQPNTQPSAPKNLSLRDPNGRKYIQQQNRNIRSGVREESAPAERTTRGTLSDVDREHVEQVDGLDQTVNASIDRTYQRLAQKERAQSTRRAPSGRCAVTFIAACNTLLSSYPELNRDYSHLFDSILRHFESQTTHVHSDAVKVFEVILQLLLRRCTVIQEIVLTDKSYLPVHVRLLVFALDLIGNKVHESLSPEDGTVFGVFGPASGNRFVAMVMLQFVDAMYAHLCPTCWGLDSVASRDVMKALTALRDALGRIVPLVEAVSRCIMEELQCQQWRQFDNNSRECFVSSVDPSDYKSFLASGTAPRTTTDSVRFLRFKTSIPRSEIETIWRLFAFLADAPTKPCDGSSSSRWRLITSVFFSDAGVLSKRAIEPVAKDIAKQPPCQEHLRCCQSEIYRLTTLLISGSLSPLPSSGDKILTKLMQKCLVFQTMGCVHSEEWAAHDKLPDLDRTDRRRLAGTWKATYLLLNRDSPGTDAVIAYMDMGEVNDARSYLTDGRILGSTTGLLSTSPMLGGCTQLLLAWSRCAPKKKVRMNQMRESVRKLVIKDCMDRANSLEQKAKVSPKMTRMPSTFEEAFASASSNTGSCNAAAVNREAAMRLSVALALAGVAENPNAAVLTAKLRTMAWESMASDEMRQRQQWVKLHDGTKPKVYGGEIFRLFSTAKALAWLSSMHFGFLPSDMQQGLSSASLSQRLSAGPEKDLDSLVFLSSCMIACLDCACDSFERTAAQTSPYGMDALALVENFSTFVASVSLWLSQFCVRANVAQTSTPPVLKNATRELRKSIFGMAAFPLRRCLACLTSSPVRGETADVALRSALGLIRTIVVFVSAHENHAGLGANERWSGTSKCQIPASGPEHPEEDLFGSIDDAAFFDIDIDATPDGDTDAFRKLWDVLIDMLNLAKPSDQFRVDLEMSQSSSKDACTSSQGRALAAGQAGAVCACLAALTSLEKQDFEKVETSLLSLFRPTQSPGPNSDPDDTYFRQIAQCFYSELCGLSEHFRQCDRLLQKRRDHIFESFIEALLDSGALERFPSINLDGIKANGGMQSEQKEKRLLTLANPSPGDCRPETINDAGARLKKGEAHDLPGSAYITSHMWSFSRNLGKFIFRMSESMPDDITEAAEVFMGNSTDLIPLVSLENECLKRAVFFRKLISYSASNGLSSGPMSFERLSNQVISSCLYQLLSISEGVSYRVRIGRRDATKGSGKMAHKHARLLELQSCFVELTVTLLAWILRESTATPLTSAFQTTLQFMRDQLFSQVLNGHDCNVSALLSQLFSIASTGAAKKPICVTESAGPALLKEMTLAAIRRSREIVMHLASSHQLSGTGNVYCLYNSLLTAAMCERDQQAVLELIANSLEPESNALSGISHLHMNRTAFQDALDTYMRRMETSRGLTLDDRKSIQQLKRLALEKILVPKLTNASLSLARKKGILRLLSRMLEASSSARERFDIQLISSIAKGIASCFRSAVDLPAVDNAVVTSAVQCAKHVLSLPHDAAITVLSWSRRRYKQDAENSCSAPPHALYLWKFATWINAMGRILIGRTEHDKKRFQTFCARRATQGQSVWSRAEKDADNDVVAVSLQLVDLEDKVFLEKENVCRVQNVYARSTASKPAASTDERLPWSPDSSLRRAAKELVAKFIAEL